MVSFQPNMQAHDDLAALFSRNLTFTSSDLTPHNPHAPVVSKEEDLKQQQQLQTPHHPTSTNSSASPASAAPAPLVFSITQHYHHSAHLARQPSHTEEEQQPPQRPASEPPQSEEPTAENVLTQHGVNPAVLSPSQLHLFRVSETNDQLRLIEFWRVAPPSNVDENGALAWNTTTVEQEERLAHMRYERAVEAEQQQRPQAAEVTMSLDGTQVQNNDSRWLALQSQGNVEPYMMSGYEELMRREYERQQTATRPRDAYSHFGTSVAGPSYTPATDPVYQQANEQWSRHQQHMEDQYGAFQHFGRPAGAMEAMEIL